MSSGRGCVAAPGQVVGDGLAAEQRARRRPQVRRQLVGRRPRRRPRSSASIAAPASVGQADDRPASSSSSTGSGLISSAPTGRRRIAPRGRRDSGRAAAAARSRRVGSASRCLEVRRVVGFLVGSRASSTSGRSVGLRRRVGATLVGWATGVGASTSSSTASSTARRRPARGRCRPSSACVSSLTIGISPVSSATVTASVLPRRRRRRPPTGGAPMVPFLASSSATEIGRVLLWLSFWSCHRLLPLDRLGAVDSGLQHPARTSPPGRFRRLRCRVSAESDLLATPTGRCPRVSIDSARMLASATNAPATICGARSALTPSNSARSAAVILEMKAMSCLRPVAVSVLFTRGPAPEGAAPVSRASDRNVFDVATARSGLPASSISAPASASSVASQSRSIATRRRPGGSSGSHSRVSRPGAQRQRQRHLGLLVDAAGQLQRAAADVDVDDAARRSSRTSGAPPGTSAGTRRPR